MRVLRDALGLGSHAFICAGNNVGGDNQKLSTAYLSSVVRDVRVTAGFGLVSRMATPAAVQRCASHARPQVKNMGVGRLELNYCIPVLQQRRFGDQVKAGLQIGLGTEFL